ncbi:MAG: acyl-CoA reductase [Bacteroidetes bacterium]|nr:acyl-CoA reductase [Bacteroidota bacterium]
MPLEKRIEVLSWLGQYMLSDDDAWQLTKELAINNNGWFTPGNIELATRNIATQYLDADKLNAWVASYPIQNVQQRHVGMVMAGNIPLVGFHDLLCGFIAGHKLSVKLSSKDTMLMKHLIDKMIEKEPSIAEQITIAEVLKGCDAYIATGSNNTARYFEQYFAKYPHIIRRNRTSVAVLDGNETEEELSLLADDIFSYFGLGCRNVTQVCIPQGYDLTKLIDACNKYSDLIYHHKYKNNFDYYLAIYLLNKVPYLSNNSMLVVQNDIPFSAVSVLHYRYYDDKADIIAELQNSGDIQCLVGKGLLPFGQAQNPGLADYADGVNTMQFLTGL